MAGLLALLAGLAGAPARADVICHYTYGGETKVLRAAPTDDPLRVRGTVIGSYFQLRVVLQTRPADLAAVKIYTYADRDGGPLLLHQATFPYPPPQPRRGAAYGFTGLQYVYEPVRDGELQYWCELTKGKHSSRREAP